MLLYLFVRREERVKGRGDEPLLDLALLGIATMRAGLVVQSCQAFIIQATFFVVPLYLQIVLGFDALKTGKTILPMSVALFVLRDRGVASATAASRPSASCRRALADPARRRGHIALLPGSGPGAPGASASACASSARDWA